MSPPSATLSTTRNKSVEKPAVAKRMVPLSKPATQPVEQKKASHRPGKPIINWFQRKLAGGSSFVKPKRAENQQPPGQGRPAAIPLRSTNRITSTPLPNKPPSKPDVARRKTISLNEEDDGELYANDLASEQSRDFEADEDASMRPLPPSIPPSPSPSSSSYVSDPRTFRSSAASTKPTTLLSIDMNGNGMAHIAQAPAAPIARLHVRSSSTATGGASVSFSALHPSPISTSTDRMLTRHASNPVVSAVPPTQAPLHTAHHPRNNPRPSSPPLDNASILTLASSAYAMPTRSAPPSALGDSMSHFGGSITYADAESTSHYLLGDDDVDASLRALRPRSSRRGSWESEASRWSARVHQQGGAGTPSLRRDGRSLWTSNSIRTGGMSGENYVYDKSDEGDDRSVEATSPVEEKTGPAALDWQPAISTPKNPSPLEVSADALLIPLPVSSDDLLLEEYEDTTPNERTHPLA